jgi:peptide-methionine (R)-S-oxide reductase
MNRRRFILRAIGLAALPLVAPRLVPADTQPQSDIGKISRSEEEWRQLLTPAQFNILREEGTEPPFSSPLNGEKRPGVYVCAGCELPLFTADMKFDSGTGWPSFYTTLPGRVETRLDFRLILPRREYHCARCGGHQGHVFDDGPQPTGQRWCNNGLALIFIPE